MFHSFNVAFGRGTWRCVVNGGHSREREENSTFPHCHCQFRFHFPFSIHPITISIAITITIIIITVIQPIHLTTTRIAIVAFCCMRTKYINIKTYGVYSVRLGLYSHNFLSVCHSHWLLKRLTHERVRRRWVNESDRRNANTLKHISNIFRCEFELNWMA